ncbi:Uncharacterized protein ycf39 [Symbiodinium microadriaticum]|uniref:Uncharacterized protein ycf39 n=1 Tax=Symbiodinium microadriaticum TaxID=2951 RepID=A0A1Q9F063_SYMMI|nr:Uncharacterized protein ycf39 [Symbiodinium microadriaticum]
MWEAGVGCGRTSGQRLVIASSPGELHLFSQGSSEFRLRSMAMALGHGGGMAGSGKKRLWPFWFWVANSGVGLPRNHPQSWTDWDSKRRNYQSSQRRPVPRPVELSGAHRNSSEMARSGATSCLASFAAAFAGGYVVACSYSTAFATGLAPATAAGKARLATSDDRALRGAPATNVEVETGLSALAFGGFLGLATATSLARSRSLGRRGAKAPTRRQATITAQMETEPAVEDEEDVPVKKTSVLVMGATGTIGRQVVRVSAALMAVLRNRADRQFSFLVDWGATVVEGELLRAESLPSESIYDIDWEGKKRLIQCCEKMKIQRYVFLSIKDCDKYQSVPLMRIKYLTEKFLAQSTLRYTVLRISGLMQPLISQYAVCVLDDQKVWGDDGSMPGIAYVDSQDVARWTASAMVKVWSTNEVIKLCEKLSGREADINTVSNAQMQATMSAAQFFDWSIDVAERLRFVEVNQLGSAGTPMKMTDTDYQLLGMDPSATRGLDEYIGEYYRRVFKKLMKGKYEPEEGEVEREKAEAAEKLNMALATDTSDTLPAGQTEEQEVLIGEQRDTAERLQKYFEDKILTEMEDDKNAWFGLTPLAELFNGRAAMMGFSLGLFTEWATEVNVANQIDLMISIFSPQGN